jgi:hypothetical protein
LAVAEGESKTQTPRVTSNKEVKSLVSPFRHSRPLAFAEGNLEEVGENEGENYLEEVTRIQATAKGLGKEAKAKDPLFNEDRGNRQGFPDYSEPEENANAKD